MSPQSRSGEKCIAILGANSLIAVDFLLRASREQDSEFRLFVRNPGAFQQELSKLMPPGKYSVGDYTEFGKYRYSAILNCVGVGDPARAVQMGSEIFAITRKFDELALGYVRTDPQARYVFLSSGAVYGSDMEKPVQRDSLARIPVNQLGPHHYYGAAKLQAELTHRAVPELNIVDVRIFNYISRRMDIGARFLITEMLAAIRGHYPFKTTARKVVRDYLHPADMYTLLDAALSAPGHANMAVDAYTRSSIDKEELMRLMVERFSLQVELTTDETSVDASGRKNVYCSENRSAARLGYQPRHSSESGIVEEVAAMLCDRNAKSA